MATIQEIQDVENLALEKAAKIAGQYADKHSPLTLNPYHYGACSVAEEIEKEILKLLKN